MRDAVLILLVVAALVVAAGGLGMALIDLRESRREIARRTDLVAPASAAPEPSPMRAGVMPRLSAVGEWFRRLFAFGMPYRWGMRAGPPLLVLTAFAGAALCWALGRGLLHLSVWIAAPLTVAAFVLVPRRLLKMQQDKAEKVFLNDFPDAIDMVVRMVRAGLPIIAAIRAIGNESPPPVGAAFAALADQVDIGILFEDALAQVGERVGLDDFRFFAVAVSLQHGTGGNIASTLEIMAEIIRKRRAARLKAQATTGEVRMSAMILGALPFVVVGGLAIMSPAYLAPLITDPRGNVIVGLAILFLSMGFLTMRQFMRRATRL